MVKSRYLVEFPAQKKEPKWFQNLGRFKKNSSAQWPKKSPKKKKHDAAIERIAQPPAPEPSEAVEPSAPERSYLEAVGDDSQVDTATFEQTGDPLLLIGRASGQRSQGDTAEALYLSPFQ